MNERSWHACEADRSSLKDLAELGAAVSGKDSEVANQSFLDWQYYNNPAGDVVTWVARDDGRSRLAGSYSVIPLRMKINDRIVTGSLSMNTQTHPEYRKQGIFKTLGEKTFDSCRSRNILLTIGIPNNNSYPGFTGALKFADVGSRQLLIRPFSARFVVDKLIKNKLLNKVVLPFANAGIRTLSARGVFNRSIDRNIRIEGTTDFGPEFDLFWTQISGNYRNMVVRDSKFLNWRFVRCPTRKYTTFKAMMDGEMVGYAVASIDKHHSYDCRVSFIVDLMVHPRTDRRSVCKALVLNVERWAMASKVDFIGMHLSTHEDLYRILKKIGYIRVPDRLVGAPQALIIRPHSEELVGDDQIMDLLNWCLMDGDNDRP